MVTHVSKAQQCVIVAGDITVSVTIIPLAIQCYLHSP